MKEEHHFTISKKARFFTLGNFDTANTLWIVLHGYGQQAEYFINNFNLLDNEEHAVVAPEGLSKFYLNGVNGRVGASWMTKVDRKTEIEDYIHYLESLVQQVIHEYGNFKKVNILGFSQGGATALRWLEKSELNYENLILWCCTVPEDVKIGELSGSANNFVLYGDEDQYVTKDRVEELKIRLKGNLTYDLICFKGKHQIPENVFKEQLQKHNW